MSGRQNEDNSVVQSTIHVAIIPYKLYSNHLFIKVKIQNSDLRFAFDTGMPMDGAVLFATEKVRQLSFNFAGETMIGGAGGEPETADVASAITLHLPGLDLPNQTILVMRKNPFPAGIIGDIDGVFGYSLFSRFVVDIDFENQLINLLKAEEFNPEAKGEKIRIDIEYGFPFFDCDVQMLSGANIPVRLVIDLGASHALALNVQSHEKITLPKNAFEFRVGRGVGGDVNGHIGRIHKLQLGRFNLINVLTSFHEGPLAKCAAFGAEVNGNLGTNALRRFNVTFDYSRELMILNPNKHFTDPFEFNMSGIQLTKIEDGSFKVDRVIQNSPASESGVQVKDVIQEINGIAASEFNHYELNLLFEVENNEVKLLISRDSKNMVINLRLRRII